MLHGYRCLMFCDYKPLDKIAFSMDSPPPSLDKFSLLRPMCLNEGPPKQITAFWRVWGNILKTTGLLLSFNLQYSKGVIFN